MSPSHRRSTVHSRWLALLYIILCLGDHFGDEDMSTDVTLEGRLLVVSHRPTSLRIPSTHLSPTDKLLTPISTGMRRLSSPCRFSRRTIYRNDPDHHLSQPLSQQQEPRQRCAVFIRYGDQDGYFHGNVCMSLSFIFFSFPSLLPRPCRCMGMRDECKRTLG